MGRRSPVAVLVLCVLASACLPAVALAWRSASAAEREAITRAARRSEAGPTQTVRVSDIHVSTEGPWASATVALFRRGDDPKDAMESVEALHRVRGAWRVVDYDAMPAADQENVELPGAPKPGWYRVIVFGVAGLLLAVAAVVLLPVAGILGGVLLALLALLGRVGGGGGGGKVEEDEQEDFSWKPPQRERCTACRYGRAQCPTCGWARTLPDEDGVHVPCPMCQGALFPCTCEDGYVPA